MSCVQSHLNPHTPAHNGKGSCMCLRVEQSIDAWDWMVRSDVGSDSVPSYFKASNNSLRRGQLAKDQALVLAPIPLQNNQRTIFSMEAVFMDVVPV